MIGPKMFTAIAFTLLISSQVSSELSLGSAHLSVYGDVPGVSPSPYYSFRVRERGSEKWLNTFALMTECTDDKFCNTTGYYDQLKDWSNTYVNFEMKDGTEVEIEITKISGSPSTLGAAIDIFWNVIPNTFPGSLFLFSGSE